jgi:hypothetical protein
MLARSVGSSERAVSNNGKDDKGREEERRKEREKELTESCACLCGEERKATEDARVGRGHGH